MKKLPSRSPLYFFFAALLAVFAQSFLFVPQWQRILLAETPPEIVLAISIILMLVAYANLTLAFYQHHPRYAKMVGVFSASLLILFALSYLRAALYQEVLLFLFLTLLSLFITWRKELHSDWLGRAGLWLNILWGGSFLLPQIFLASNLYQHVLSQRFFFALLFISMSLLKLIADRKPDTTLALYSTKLLAFPWIGWIVLLSLDVQLPLFIPATLFTFALLTFGLIPFEKFRLPDNRILGHSTFPLLVLLFSTLLAMFTFLQNLVVTSLPVRESLFIFMQALAAFLVYAVMRVHYLVFTLIDHSGGDIKESAKDKGFEKFVELLFAPIQRESQPRSEWQAKQIKLLSEQVLAEQENARRFDMLSFLRREFDEFHDDPVSAQLVVNAIEKYFDADIVGILLHKVEAQELAVYAVSGKLKAYVPASYRQSIDVGTLGRAARMQKVLVINDTSTDSDYFSLQGEEIASEVFVPLVEYGQLKGVLMVGHREKSAFSAADIRILEEVVQELLKTWERSGHNRRMRTLIQSSASLSTSLDPQSAMEEISKVARDTLLARFAFVALLDQDGTFTRISSVGDAPDLQEYLSQDLRNNPFLKIALDQTAPHRIRDVRRYKNIPSVPIDNPILRGVMLVPIRLHGVSIGAIIAFGKQGAIFFSEKDESLANLLATQAAAAIESSWLIQELRTNAFTTNLLYTLSLKIIQTDTTREAARLIAETAQRLTQSASVSIILFSSDQHVETALQLRAGGRFEFGNTIPQQFIEQTLMTGETITISAGDDSAVVYLPIQTPLRKYGVMGIEFQDSERQAAAQTQSLKTLANQAAMALERAMLLLDLRRKAEELEAAFEELEKTYDQTLIALMTALDARDRETEGHSERVGNVATRIGTELGLDTDQQTILRRGALLHDIGKIGVSDNILLKPGVLTDDEWHVMRQHPEIGARIVKGIPFLEETMPVIKHHHERWNGSGYPLGLAGEDIPITARIFAVADVFDALTSVRPYRKTSTHEEAFSYLKENAGILFDPKIVDVFEKLLRNGEVETLVNA